MPKPLAKYKRKILYRTNGKKHRVTPKVSIPRWWVKDTEVVELKIYEDKIVIERAGVAGDE